MGMGGGEEVPLPLGLDGVPHQDRMGHPPVRTGWGYPLLAKDGVHPVRKDGGTPPPSGRMRVPLLRRMGVHLCRLDGVPLVKVWTDKQTENSTFSSPSDAGGNKPFVYSYVWRANNLRSHRYI